jgi:RIO kinase 1
MPTDDELTAPIESRERAPRPTSPPVQKAPVVKQSYEASADVRRWLLEQALDASSKPPFEPSLLAGRRDRDWILSSLTHFYERELITDVLQEVSSGKEATVYRCAADPATGVASLAAKVYRPRMFRSLRNDAVYRESRAQYDRDGRPVRDKGRHGRDGAKTTRGRAAQVTNWIDYEFATHQLLHEAGADVPRPLAQSGNAVLMEYIGDDDGPAPLLYEVRLSREEARPLFERLLHNIELWLSCDRIHGDLSAYNILYRPGIVTIIDFAQALDPRHNPAVYPLFERDIERVCRYFARYGIVADPGALASEIWLRQQGGLF